MKIGISLITTVILVLVVYALYFNSNNTVETETLIDQLPQKVEVYDVSHESNKSERSYEGGQSESLEADEGEFQKVDEAIEDWSQKPAQLTLNPNPPKPNVEILNALKNYSPDEFALLLKSLILTNDESLISFISPVGSNTRGSFEQMLSLERSLSNETFFTNFITDVYKNNESIKHNEIVCSDRQCWALFEQNYTVNTDDNLIEPFFETFDINGESINDSMSREQSICSEYEFFDRCYESSWVSWQETQQVNVYDGRFYSIYNFSFPATLGVIEDFDFLQVDADRVTNENGQLETLFTAIVLDGLNHVASSENKNDDYFNFAYYIDLESVVCGNISCSITIKNGFWASNDLSKQSMPINFFNYCMGHTEPKLKEGGNMYDITWYECSILSEH